MLLNMFAGGSGGYTVSAAGSVAALGHYSSYSTSDGVESFKHDSAEWYLFRYDSGSYKFWAVGVTHGGPGGACYITGEAAPGDTPYIGTYTYIQSPASAPAAVVSAG